MRLFTSFFVLTVAGLGLGACSSKSKGSNPSSTGGTAGSSGAGASSGSAGSGATGGNAGGTASGGTAGAGGVVGVGGAAGGTGGVVGIGGAGTGGAVSTCVSPPGGVCDPFKVDSCSKATEKCVFNGTTSECRVFAPGSEKAPNAPCDPKVDVCAGKFSCVPDNGGGPTNCRKWCCNVSECNQTGLQTCARPPAPDGGPKPWGHCVPN